MRIDVQLFRGETMATDVQEEIIPEWSGTYSTGHTWPTLDTPKKEAAAVAWGLVILAHLLEVDSQRIVSWRKDANPE